MRPISDALELLTAQHEEIDDLLATVIRTGDAKAFDNLADKIVGHLALEQQLFYPVIAATISREVLTELMSEHAAIKRVLGELVWIGVDDPAFCDKLAEIEHLLAGHSGWQEEQLFPSVAETVSAETLSDLGRQLQQLETAFPFAAAA